MGRVWLARDEMLYRPVAVKQVVPPTWMTPDERDELRYRTLREARTAARLNHPNVVRVYDVVHDDDSPWIVMEYVPSRSVQQILETDGPLSPLRTAEVGLAVLAALRAAHASGVLHRDVKPHNVLIAEDGRVVLTDFGLATVDGGDGGLTRDGVVLGSPQYVSPERAADGVSTVESDLWSLGATLYAAVEGRSPYRRPTTMATLTALAVSPPDPTRLAGPLRPVLAGLLRRDPRQRLGAEEVERLLRRIADPPPRSGRHPLALARSLARRPPSQPVAGPPVPAETPVEPPRPSRRRPPNQRPQPDGRPQPNQRAGPDGWSQAPRRDRPDQPGGIDRPGGPTGRADPPGTVGPAAGHDPPGTVGPAAGHDPPGDARHDPQRSAGHDPQGDAGHYPQGDAGHYPPGDAGHYPPGEAGHGPVGVVRRGPPGDGGAGVPGWRPWRRRRSQPGWGTRHGPDRQPGPGRPGPEPPGPVGPGTPGQSRRRRGPLGRGWRVGAGALALALLAGLGTGLTLRADRSGEHPTDGSGEHPTDGSADRPAVAVAGAFPCAPPPELAVPVTVAPRPPDERFGLVDNWTWYTDPSGFRIAVPIGWLRYTDGRVVCFREPVAGTGRMLSVDPSTPPTSDGQRYWLAEERRLTGAGLLAGYEQVGIGPLDIRAGGAIWECRWTNARGDRVQTARMLINTSADRAYTVSWLTREFDWAVNQSYLRMVQTSFRPVD
ncbi:protein kinase [Micromonospora sp. WMMD1102]|uniref:protein kinase domain-containing protein n=1 Tax=Micromonospora sp. WMMD1102 TaxID=3016105 RepID=UPI00324289D9